MLTVTTTTIQFLVFGCSGMKSYAITCITTQGKLHCKLVNMKFAKKTTTAVERSYVLLTSMGGAHTQCNKCRTFAVTFPKYLSRLQPLVTGIPYNKRLTPFSNIRVLFKYWRLQRSQTYWQKDIYHIYFFMNSFKRKCITPYTGFILTYNKIEGCI